MNEANRASQAGEQRYRYLFENLPICIFVVDPTVTPAIILDVNQRAKLVYGYKAAELVGNPVACLVAEESRKSIEHSIQRAVWGEPVITETTNRHRDGTLFPARSIATLDPVDSDRIFITVEDITAERIRRSESKAIARERLRIAHEIHDGIAQDLAALRLKSVLWRQLADIDPPGMHAVLDEFQAKLSIAISDLHRAIFALRPVDLEALGFFQALTELVRNFTEYSKLVTRLDVSGSIESLPANYELPLFRIIQEALSNVHQHARASSVYVHMLVGTRDGVVVSIRDNGSGFYPDQIEKINPFGHFGLRQMRERILDLGGTLDIQSVVGQGTELCITLPPISKATGDIWNCGVAYAVY